MIEELIQSERAELTQSSKKAVPVVLSTRVRLARNLADDPFPARASSSQRRDILASCTRHLSGLPVMEGSSVLEIESLSELEKQVLVERHLVSRELCEANPGAAALISRDQTCAVMVNEEDHMRIQMLKSGFDLGDVWSSIDALDDQLEASVDYAFSPQYGYLTACPTNLGTALRASVMMHLPGLVIANQMEKVIRAVNQLGLTVRGLFGEGSDATGHVFQISNQQTLGESEKTILDRLEKVLKTVIDHEVNARYKYLEEHRADLVDKMGRAYGTLRHARVLSSNEAMNHLSLLRLASDLGVIPEQHRSDVDRLFIECQPGHVQFAEGGDSASEARDSRRADLLRSEIERLPGLSFDNLS